MYPVNAASVQPGIHTSVRTGKKKESVMSPAEALSTAPRRPACLEVPSRCVIKVQTWLTMDKYESKRSRQHSAPGPQPRGATCGRCRR